MGAILDGKKIANEIQSEVAHRVKLLKDAHKRVPHLAIILIGDDGPSHSYVSGNTKACQAVGFDYTLLQFAATISENKLCKITQDLHMFNKYDLMGIIRKDMA